MNQLDCQRAVRALHRYVDGECPPAERTALEVHLAECADCRMALRALREEAEMLSMGIRLSEPACDLYERLAARLPSRRRLWLIRNRRALLAAAAVLAVAVVGVLVAGRVGGRASAVAVAPTGGHPEVRTPEGEQWLALEAKQVLEPGSLLRAPAGPPASVEFEDWTQLVLRGGSRVVIGGRRKDVAHWWRVEEGELWATFGQGRFRVDTGAGSVGDVDGGGCELLVSVSRITPAATESARQVTSWTGLSILPSAHAAEPEAACRARVIVLRGIALAWNGYGRVELRSGMETRLEPGRAPTRARAADLARALEWTRRRDASMAAFQGFGPIAERPQPAPPQPPPREPAAPEAPPFEEAVVGERAVVPRRMPLPPQERQAIKVPEVEAPPPGPPANVRAQALLGGTVAVTWEPPREGARAVVYKVWRKAEGEDSYKQVTIPPLAAGVPLGHYDHKIARGRKYAYRISAVDEAGRDGPMSAPVAVTACDFEVSYRGGNADQAVIVVTRRVHNSWVRHVFTVRKRDAARGHTGAIGNPVDKPLREGLQTVDFTTGYSVIDIVRVRHPVTKQMSFELVIEDREGRRSRWRQAVRRNNGH